MSNDNGQPATSLATIVDELKEIQKGLQQREDDARAALDAVLAEKKSIDQMINAAERSGRYVARPRKGKSGDKNTTRFSSEEALEEYWQRLKALTFDAFEDIPGGFATSDVTAKLGVHKSTGERIVRTLREQGRIRLVGQRYSKRNPKHTGKPAPVYVLIDG